MLTFFNQLISIETLLPCLVATTTVCLVALLAARLLQRRAALAHAVLLIALAVTALAPVISVLVAGRLPITVSEKNGANLLAARASNLTRAQRAENSVDFDTANSSYVLSNRQYTDSAEPTISLSPNSESGDSSPGSSVGGTRQHFPTSAPTILLTTWILVAAFLLIRFLAQLIHLRRLVLYSRAPTSSKLLCAFGVARNSIPNSHSVELGTLNVAVPVAVNWPQRKVLVSDDFSGQLSSDSLRRILIHELAHVVRRDQVVLIAQRVLACVYWPFVPLHLLNRAICRTREDVCDNYVLQSGGEPRSDFCRDLLRVTIPTNCNRTMPLATGLMGPRSLERRIAGLLSKNRNTCRRIGPQQFAAVCVPLLTITCMIAAVQFETRESPPHDYISHTNDPQLQPLFRSVRLSDRQPKDLQLAKSVSHLLNNKQHRVQFARVRYGNPASDRVTLMLVTRKESEEFDLYVDRDRDNRLTVDDLVTGSGRNRHCDLDALVQDRADSKSGIKLPRKVIFRRGLLTDRIGLATTGFMQGTMRIDDREVSVYRQDANANGLFDDLKDRIWIDFNADARREIDEQFQIKPVQQIRGQRYSMATNPGTQSLAIKRLDDAIGQVQLSPRLKVTGSTITHLVVSFAGEDGSVFTVSGLKPVEVTAGRYTISNVAISVKSGDGVTARSFVFSSRGSLDHRRIFEITKDQLTVVDPLGDLDFQSTPATVARAGHFLPVDLALYTTDGLLISHADTGITDQGVHGGSTNTVHSEIRTAGGETTGQCTTGFY